MNNSQDLRVLIIEDHEDTARSLASLLEAWGCEAVVAPTGTRAKLIAPRFRPRLVLLDLGLPDAHGYQVARELREHLGTGNTAFVVVTGWTHPVDQNLSTMAGISHHLVKPVHPEVLRRIVEQYRPAAA